MIQKSISEIRTWKGSSYALQLLNKENLLGSFLVCILLRKDFPHRYYILSLIAQARNQSRRAIHFSLTSIKLNRDVPSSSFYVTHLHSLKWSNGIEINTFIESQVKSSGLHVWKFPKIDPSEISPDRKNIENLTSARTSRGLSIDALKNNWTEVNSDFLKQNANYRIPMDPIVGVSGMQNATIGEVIKYFRWINEILPNYWDWQRALDFAEHIKLTDLGSMMDASLILSQTTLFGLGENRRIRILEIGGGYGRLAEALLANFADNIEQYDLVDAIPVSLDSARTYLNKVAGKASTFPINDISIIPSWEFFPENRVYDLVINIESFQEMEIEYIQYWLDLTKKVIRKNSWIYFSNSFDYVNKTIYKYERNWSIVYSQNTPRSWTPNHPTTIMIVN